MSVAAQEACALSRLLASRASERNPLDDLARAFFAKLRLIFYAGAALPQDLWERLEVVSLAAAGERVPMTSSWGTTETSPLSTAAHFPIERAGPIGVPVPGAELKLVPAGDRYELRVKGPNIMAGYLRDPQSTTDAFDEDGFFRTGDAARWVDEGRPEAGLLFAGRLSEEFKLSSGTWVRATTLRTQLIDALQPYVRDLVIAAPDRPWLGALVWLALGLVLIFFGYIR